MQRDEKAIREAAAKAKAEADASWEKKKRELDKQAETTQQELVRTRKETEILKEQLAEAKKKAEAATGTGEKRKILDEIEALKRKLAMADTAVLRTVAEGVPRAGTGSGKYRGRGKGREASRGNQSAAGSVGENDGGLAVTDSQILQALRICSDRSKGCSACQFSYDNLCYDNLCYELLTGAAADLIERLTAENAALQEKWLWKPVFDGGPEREGCYLVLERSRLAFL